MTRSVTLVAAKFARNDVRNIRFVGNPNEDKRITVHAHGEPLIIMHHVRGAWEAHAKGAKLDVTQSKDANHCYRKAVRSFWN